MDSNVGNAFKFVKAAVVISRNFREFLDRKRKAREEALKAIAEDPTDRDAVEEKLTSMKEYFLEYNMRHLYLPESDKIIFI